MKRLHSMKAKLALIGVLATTLLACATTPAPSPDPSLVEVNGNQIDHLWVKPGVDFSAYHSFILDEATVSYREAPYKFWKESKKALQRRLDSSAEKLQSQFHRNFVRRTEQEERYKVVTQAAAGVLKLTPALIDVYLVNPDETLVTGLQKVYARSAGDMTLRMEVRDSLSGELLAVFEDYQEADSWNKPQRQDNITLARETRIIVSRWAGRLSDGLLDKASTE